MKHYKIATIAYLCLVTVVSASCEAARTRTVTTANKVNDVIKWRYSYSFSHDPSDHFEPSVTSEHFNLSVPKTSENGTDASDSISHTTQQTFTSDHPTETVSFQVKYAPRTPDGYAGIPAVTYAFFTVRNLPAGSYSLVSTFNDAHRKTMRLTLREITHGGLHTAESPTETAY